MRGGGQEERDGERRRRERRRERRAPPPPWARQGPLAGGHRSGRTPAQGRIFHTGRAPAARAGRTGGIGDNGHSHPFSLMIRDLPQLLALLALAAILVWAPLPYGSVTYDARAGLQAGCALALLIVLGSRRRGSL